MFELTMGPDRLLGFVGRNGHLYWEAFSVGVLLRYKAPKQFTRNRYTVKVTQAALPADALQNVKWRLLTHVRVLGLLEKSKNAYVGLIYDRLNRCEFHVEVTQGGAQCLHVQMCPQSRPGSKPFLAWLEGYKEALLNPAPAVDEKVLSSQKMEYSPCGDSPPYVPTSPAHPPPPLKFQFNGYGSPTYVPGALDASPPPPPESPPSLHSPPPPPPPPSRAGSSISLGIPPPRYSSASRPYTPYSPGDPVYTPTPPPPPPSSLVQEEPLNLSKKTRQAPQLEGFSFWIDRIPPSKIFVFVGSEARCFVEKD